MDEMNQNVAENLGIFLMEIKEDVIRGLQDYLLLRNGVTVKVM